MYCICFMCLFATGLDYLTEYQMEDPNADPCYICDLCQSKMDMRQVINHVIGIRHRHKYMVSRQTTVLSNSVTNEQHFDSKKRLTVTTAGFFKMLSFSAWHCWLGQLTRKIFTDVTYNVFGGTLNPTLPYMWTSVSFLLGQAKHFTSSLNTMSLDKRKGRTESKWFHEGVIGAVLSAAFAFWIY